MKFTQEELETIKDALTIAINESSHMLNDDVIKILNKRTKNT
jgi:hypothetical protein